MKTLGIIGGSGHGKVVADIAKKLGYDEIVFFDDNKAVDYCGVYPVVGASQDIFHHNCDALVAAVGHCGRRWRWGEVGGGKEPRPVSGAVTRDGARGW